MSDPSASVRGLVVDDDPAVVELLGGFLTRRGIVAHSAADGQEAAALLRENDYDLAFIDLLLPVLSGEALLRQIEAGSLKRPVSLALISAAPNLAGMSHAAWARNVALLSKPFAAPALHTFIDRAFQGTERVAAPRPIVFAGSGSWAEAAAIVATNRGGRCLVTTDLQQLQACCENENPLAVVLGPPITAPDLGPIATLVKQGRMGADIAVFVALMDENVALTGNLLTTGVDRVVSIRQGVGGLSEELLRVANLRRRVHRRVPLKTPVTMRERDTVHIGRAFDIGEGGLGVECESRPTDPELMAEFALPGGATPIKAECKLAWVDDRDPARGRFGLRFTRVDAPEHIRNYVAGL